MLSWIVPFLTVLMIVAIALLVYVRIEKVSGGNSTVIFVVMLSTVLVLSTAFVVGDKIRRKITTENPVQEILEATEKIASGDFSVRLTSLHSYERLNEYDLIKNNLNLMASELEKSEILKGDFISNVSHELKTPLSVIQNYVWLLGDENLSEEDRKKYATTVVDATKRLSSLVTNVLKLNKLENQQLKPEYESVRLEQMLEQAVIDFEDLIDRKNLEIDCQLEQVEIVSAKSYLEIVWSNLLSNAIKFTPDGGKIAVRVKKVPQGALVEIEDSGCGISKEVGARIFDKFYQGDTSHSGEGNGLGLALVKKVIGILGGEISVVSELSKGSTFSVILKGE